MHACSAVSACWLCQPALSQAQVVNESWRLVEPVGAGAILSVGLFRHPQLNWAKMEQLFDVDGGVSGGTALLFSHALQSLTFIAM